MLVVILVMHFALFVDFSFHCDRFSLPNWLVLLASAFN